MGLKQRSSIVLIGLLKAVEGVAIFGLICAAISPSADAQAVVATIAVGTDANVVAVNPVTNKIYVAGPGSGNNVTVIDGATNNTTTVPVLSGPGAGVNTIAVNAVTNQIYVENCAGIVTVIDGATNNTTNVNVPVMAGLDPNFIAVNPTTNQIYVVAGSGSNPVHDDGDVDGAVTPEPISCR